MNYPIYVIRANPDGFLVAHILPLDSAEVLKIPEQPSLKGECYGTSSELEDVVTQRWEGAQRIDMRDFQSELTTRGGNSSYIGNL
jgi:hypothetical protein